MAFILRAVRSAGGWVNALKQTMRMNEVRIGSQVGSDEFENIYYENKEYFYGRDRWVDYKRKDYDASQVPPEWHCWLHHMTDLPPTVANHPQRKFLCQHEENLSGTSREYVPYSTTKEKVIPWKPSKTSV